MTTQIFKPYIAGKWLDMENRDIQPIRSPASGKIRAEYAAANTEDAERAAQAAQSAFDHWRQMPALQRAQRLREIATKTRENQELLARQITLEQGKPLAEARLEISGVAEMFDYFSGIADALEPQTDQSSDGKRRIVEQVPVGPVIIITTWNFPVETAAVHLAPALAAGCTTVVLANNHTPTSVAMLVELIGQCDLPDGAVNLVMGDSVLLSQALIKHPGTRHLSYTGSVSVGRLLASQCGEQVMRATLELGGNAPAIILPGTDIEKTVDELIGKRFWNAGQVCTAPNRIFVHRSFHDAFADLAGRYARGLVLGDGCDSATTMGPLANAERVQAMQKIAANALSTGARAILNEPASQIDGHFYAPRVFSHVPDHAIGMSEEVFGPIACIAPFDDIDDIVERANNCPLGLSGYVYGPDPDEAVSIARRLQVGSVGVNQPTTAFVDTPFGGLKSSGLGAVGGATAINEYLFPQLIAQPR